jgi:hypothetical protein
MSEFALQVLAGGIGPVTKDEATLLCAAARGRLVRAEATSNCAREMFLTTAHRLLRRLDPTEPTVAELLAWAERLWAERGQHLGTPSSITRQSIG